MTQRLNTHFLPKLVTQEELAGDCVVVIDVLRASTTICHALAAGAEAVIPCLQIADARELAKRLGDRAVLGGEREGVKIADFDLGNSPTEYQPDVVLGKTVVFTTTNGTAALQACVAASRVVVGAFVNLTALCEELAQEETVHLLCAGTHGEVTREDALLAGAVVEHFFCENLMLETNDQSILALDAWQAATGGSRAQSVVARCLAATQGGRNLTSLGLTDDIELAAIVDGIPVVPELDRQNWSIHLARAVKVEEA